MNRFVVGLATFLTLFAHAQEPSLDVEKALTDLERNSGYLMRNQARTLKAYESASTRLVRDARSKSGLPYEGFFSDIVSFESNDGSTVFKWTHRLNAASKALLEKWRQTRYLSPDYARARLNEIFHGELHPAYWRTLTTTYVWIETIRRAYLYGASVDLRSGSYASMADYLNKMHDQAQTIIGIMGRLRADANFSSSEPHWEGQYAKFFHHGLLLNLESKTPQSDLTHYFAPYFAPLLVPASDDIETLETLRARYPELRDIKQVQELIDRLKKQQTERATSEPSTERPAPGQSPSSPSQQPQDQFKEEPAHVKSNEALQRQILRMQFQQSRGEQLTLDAELKEVLGDLKAELAKLVNDYPFVTEIINQCDSLLNANEMDADTIRKRLGEILTGPKGLRPGYPSFKPLPPTHSPVPAEDETDDTTGENTDRSA